MLFTQGAVRRLEAGGVPLGLFPDAAYKDEALGLKVGDTLVLFSDGLSETESARGDVFGDDGVVASVTRNSAEARRFSPASWLTRTHSAVTASRRRCDGDGSPLSRVAVNQLRGLAQLALVVKI